MSQEDIENRIGKIETELTDVVADVASIKAAVTNHLPSAIENVQVAVDKLTKRVKPLETKATKVQGVSEFLSIIIKVIGIAGASVWTILQVLKHVAG